MDDLRRAADHFVRLEKAFHLGVLPTEQAHPKTRGFAETMATDAQAGIRMLQSVDADVTVAAGRVLADAAYARLVDAMASTLAAGGRICFSGCGATGRLSILLESAYRACWRDLRTRSGDLLAPSALRAEEAVVSIMTGGDFALVRSVEGFEDYLSFGQQQVREMGIGSGDVLVAVSEGGETSSVIGTVQQALAAGALVFFVCNNPLTVLAANVERSRSIITDPRVIALDLSSGPMAIAGSTRMQATTSELLVLGTALESALVRYVQQILPPAACQRLGMQTRDPVSGFSDLLRDLARPEAVDAMVGWVGLEESAYRSRGALTYFSDDMLLDIFTDTTERAPTFSFPPFRAHDDALSPRSLAFVKNPLVPTDLAWQRMLGRQPRCLTWNASMYEQLGAEPRIVQAPPALHREALFRFRIGNEDDPSRRSEPADCAALVLVGAERAETMALVEAFGHAAAGFPFQATLSIGSSYGREGITHHIPCRIPATPLRLWDHLACKLVLNTISTATAARLRRLRSNWMVHVETTNKKLIDRGTRLIAELTGLGYAEACYELHRSRADIERTTRHGDERRSPVALTLERLGKQGTIPLH